MIKLRIYLDYLKSYSLIRLGSYLDYLELLHDKVEKLPGLFKATP